MEQTANGANQDDEITELQQLTIDELLDQRASFKEQREQMKVCIGFTFNQRSWDIVRSKFEEPDIPIDKWNIDGIKCYIVPGQEEPMVGWYSELALDLWIKLDGKWPTRPKEYPDHYE